MSEESMIFKGDVFICPKHGKHFAVMHISIPKDSIEIDYCCNCMVEKFDEIGIRRMAKQSNDENSK